jgi:hypothetical protein
MVTADDEGEKEKKRRAGEAVLAVMGEAQANLFSRRLGFFLAPYR